MKLVKKESAQLQDRDMSWNWCDLNAFCAW